MSMTIPAAIPISQRPGLSRFSPTEPTVSGLHSTRMANALVISSGSITGRMEEVIPSRKVLALPWTSIRMPMARALPRKTR